MRIIHTADWHLGKKMELQERLEEQELFLQWLLQCIEAQQAEALIVAGDVFDTGSPSNAALQLYYNFLVALRSTCCRQAIIVGGNHDSAATLQAPSTLLRALQVHVVGAVPAQETDQIIPLHNAQGQVEAVVAAVPFLRDRDVRLSIPGESETEKEQRLRQGITDHYSRLLPYMEPYREQGIPLIATGHLFVQGATPTDSEKEIHVGTLGQLPASAFPEAYSYIGLGHLHRPQAAGGQAHIRYSGSPIPLSFSESRDAKSVTLLQVQPGAAITITEVPIPCYRPLLRAEGSPEQVLEKVARMQLPAVEGQLPAWVEVQAITPTPNPDLQQALEAILQQQPGFGQLFLRQRRQRAASGIQQAARTYHSLADMSPEHVFALRLSSLGLEAEAEELQATFSEALQLMREKEGSV